MVPPTYTDLCFYSRLCISPRLRILFSLRWTDNYFHKVGGVVSVVIVRIKANPLDRKVSQGMCKIRGGVLGYGCGNV